MNFGELIGVSQILYELPPKLLKETEEWFNSLKAE